MHIFRSPELWLNEPSVVASRSDLILNRFHSPYSRSSDVLQTTVIPHCRIGSASTEGEVYKLDLYVDDKITPAALKLMPIRSEAEFNKNNQEMIHAEHASDLVVQNVSPHFPLLYGSGYCPDVKFFKNSHFQEAASDYSCLKHLLETHPIHAKRIKQLIKGNMSINDVIDHLNLEPLDCSTFPSSAHYLLSELAIEDLRTWASRSHDIEDWFAVCSQVIDAISDCHNCLQINHNDLHGANILVTSTESCDLLCLIHDFGRSELLTAYNWKHDYEKIFDDFRRIKNMPINIDEIDGIILQSETEDELRNKFYKIFT